MGEDRCHPERAGLVALFPRLNQGLFVDGERVAFEAPHLTTPKIAAPFEMMNVITAPLNVPMPRSAHLAPLACSTMLSKWSILSAAFSTLAVKTSTFTSRAAIRSACSISVAAIRHPFQSIGDDQAALCVAPRVAARRDVEFMRYAAFPLDGEYTLRYVQTIEGRGEAPTGDTKMTIRIEITHGSRFVSPADTDRALEAAIAALGSVDPVAASAEYDRQIEQYLGDTSRLTGRAFVWGCAEVAANLALTEGWHDPNGASCEVIAE